MLTARRRPPGWLQVLRWPLNSAEHLLWTLQGGSRRTRVTYSESQSCVAWELRLDLLPTFIPLVHVRVQVDVGNELV